jgi:hypothetical protein
MAQAFFLEDLLDDFPTNDPEIPRSMTTSYLFGRGVIKTNEAIRKYFLSVVKHLKIKPGDTLEFLKIPTISGEKKFIIFFWDGKDLVLPEKALGLKAKIPPNNFHVLEHFNPDHWDMVCNCPFINVRKELMKQFKFLSLIYLSPVSEIFLFTLPNNFSEGPSNWIGAAIWHNEKKDTDHKKEDTDKDINEEDTDEDTDEDINEDTDEDEEDSDEDFNEDEEDSDEDDEDSDEDFNEDDEDSDEDFDEDSDEDEEDMEEKDINDEDIEKRKMVQRRRERPDKEFFRSIENGNYQVSYKMNSFVEDIFVKSEVQNFAEIGKFLSLCDFYVSYWSPEDLIPIGERMYNEPLKWSPLSEPPIWNS